jgi:hypothetical protein
MRESKTAHNIRLKEINKKGALIVTRTFLLSTYICAYMKVCASNPPFYLLL